MRQPQFQFLAVAHDGLVVVLVQRLLALANQRKDVALLVLVEFVVQTDIRFDLLA